MLCLEVPTDPAWADQAVHHLEEVLRDHAHCELKAATNAMSLCARYPDEPDLVLALTDLAAEELAHFRRVMQILRDRNINLGMPSVDEYAAMLRKASHDLPARHIERYVLVDRLLIGAIIEARSCERFKLLANALEALGREPALVAFYLELFAAEAKHFRTYVDLASLAARDLAGEVPDRLSHLAKREGGIVRNQSTPLASVHG